ncbi:MAG: hypothetical protein ACE5GE_14535, partial [Phycisphaerae bacterium]
CHTDMASPVENRCHTDMATPVGDRCHIDVDNRGHVDMASPAVVETGDDYGRTHPARPIADVGRWDHQPRPRRSFSSDVSWTLLFFTDPPTLIAFFAIWAALVVGPVIPFVSILVTFWYCAFRFELVRMAAAGEEGLPSVGWSQIFDDLIMPALYWTASWMFVLIPAGLYVIVGLKGGWVSWNDVSTAMLQGTSGLLGGLNGVSGGFAALVYLGIFFWPIAVLCLALGGATTLYRVDLIFKTVIGTFSGYALTVGIVFGVTLLGQFLGNLVGSSAAGTAPASTGPLGLGIGGAGSMLNLIGRALSSRVLVIGVTLYAEIVAMRVIGLYYHHHKRGFAWSWG